MCYLEENQYRIIPQDGKKRNVFFDQKAVISKVKKEQILLTVFMLDKQKSNIYLCKHLRKKIYDNTSSLRVQLLHFYRQGTNTAQRVGKN